MKTLILIASLLVAWPALAATPDVKTLNDQSDRAWAEDVRAWSSYAFDRHVTRRSLDADGNETFHQEMRFRVTPTADGFDELLLEMDDRPPTDNEVKEHRSKAKFSEHYQQAEKLELDNPLGENLALLGILQMQDYRLAGEKVVDGIPCYAATFEARPVPEGASVLEMLQYSVRGSGCFSKEGHHLVTFEMESVRPLEKWPAGMNSLQMTMKGRPVEGGWALSLSEVKSELVVFGKNLRKFNTYRYTDFRRQPR